MAFGRRIPVRGPDSGGPSSLAERELRRGDFSPGAARGAKIAGIGLIVLGTLAAYHGSFHAPFLFDDRDSILRNPSIRSWARALFPPQGEGQTVAGRPLLNLSFALNYALSGYRVWSYHALNLAIHILAGLTLFGVLRRTFLAMRTFLPGDPTILAFVIASIWAVHPLQTESVTYVAQRAESLMGLFYLLTLYCFIRGVDAEGVGPSFAQRATAGEKAARRRSLCWFGLSWLACLFGMATKEVMVSAPLLVLLYDRTFAAGSFRRAWRGRRKYYLALGTTWLPLLFLVTGAGDRGGTIGRAAGVTPWQYLLCQSEAIVHYLRLSFWPAPLVFDYGSNFVGLGRALPAAGFDLALLGATGIALWRRPVLGFLGAWFFVLLAPSSSFVGGSRQMLAEHRMYLPLAAPIALAVVGLYLRWGRRSLVLPLAAALLLGLATSARNADYRSALVLYRDTIAKRPANPWAYSNYGLALGEAGDPAGALRQFARALTLKPDLAEAHFNRGVLLAKEGRLAEAIAAYREALRFGSGGVETERNLSLLLLQSGQPVEAVERARRVVALEPTEAESHLLLGNALWAEGAAAEAAGEFERALALNPRYWAAEYNFGLMLLNSGQSAEGAAHLERARKLDSSSADDCCRLGLAFVQLGRWADAQAQFDRAVSLKPDFAEAQLDLGNALMMTGRFPEAIGHYQRAVALSPDSAEAHYNLGSALARVGRIAESAAQDEAALALRPDFPEARRDLATARQRLDGHR